MASSDRPDPDSATPVLASVASQLLRAESEARRMRFSPELERAYRAHLDHEYLGPNRALLLAGLVGLALFTAFDAVYAQGEVNRFLLTVRFGLQIPLLALALLLLRLDALHGFQQTMIAVVAVGLGGSFLLVGSVDEALARDSASYDGMMLLTFAIYLYGGMRLYAAAAVGLPLAAAWMLVHALRSGTGPDFWEGTLFLALSNALGALAGWQLEMQRRLAWVRRRLLDHASEHDALTGLYSRAAGRTRLVTLLRVGRREHRELGLALLDVDEMSALNALRGHAAGDRALVAVAGVLRGRARRPLDFCARLADDRLLVVLADTGRDVFERILVNVREDVSALNIAHPGSTSAPHLTVTIAGLAVPDASAADPDGLLDALQRRLAEVRRVGRNRVDVVTWEPARRGTVVPLHRPRSSR